MSVDIFSRVRGSASFHFMAQDFWGNDVAAFDIMLKPWELKSNAQGPIDKRVGGRLVQVTFTPVGTWTEAQLAVLFPYLNPRIGDFNTPIRNVTEVVYGTGVITVPDHGFLTGTGVRMGAPKTSNAVLPSGVAKNTTYYVSVVDENNLKLSDTEAHAVAGTNFVAMTDDGSGSLFLIQNTPLTITTVDGYKLTIWNAAIVDMPPLSLGALNSAMKQIKFEGYTLHGQNWSDANSLFTPATGQIGAVPPDQSQIPSVSYEIDWATRLPVESIDDVGNSLEVPAHGLSTAQAITLDVLSEGGSLPSALTAGTTYYVIVVDVDHIKLATTSENAGSGTAIALVTAGAGTIDVVSAVQVEGIEPREAIDISFPVTWGDVVSGSAGLVCRSITKVDAKTEFVPTNLDLNTILNELALQGGSAALGQSLPSANLDIYGPNENPFIRIFGATLENTPTKFGSEADRIDKLTFGNKRTYRGATVNPIAVVGVAAPTE